MLIRPLLLALAAAALTLPASAQTMEFNCPAPGTTIVFDSGLQAVARGKEGSDCLMESVGAAPFRMRALMMANPGPDGSDSTALIASIRPERLWPLEVGKRVEASHSSSKGSWNYILTVARKQQLEGPGGALYDTYLIEMIEQASSGPYRSISRWWISPKVNYLLRFDFSDSNGQSNRALVTKISN